MHRRFEYDGMVLWAGQVQACSKGGLDVVKGDQTLSCTEKLRHRRFEFDDTPFVLISS